MIDGREEAIINGEQLVGTARDFVGAFVGFRGEASFVAKVSPKLLDEVLRIADRSQPQPQPEVIE